MNDKQPSDLAAARSLSTDAMIAELMARNVLEVRRVCHEPGWLWLVSVDWIEADA